MPANMTFDDLKKAVDRGEIDTVLTCLVDMQGRLMGKRFHATHFINGGHVETHGCNYLLATDLEMETVQGYKATSWASGYGDYVHKPDLTTIRRVPWLPGTAMVMCDVLDHTHAEVPHSPRAILKRQIARARALGFDAMMATELEFYLFDQSYDALNAGGYRDMQTFGRFNADYAIFGTTKEESVMRAIRNGLYGAGIPVENSKGEAEAGQEEINIKYSDALDTADMHTITKNACKEIAHAAGHGLTFMAKYATDRAGLLAHASDVTYFLAPYINSYKRFTVGMFAPTKAVWSTDNRTAGYRVCGAGTKGVRIECRVGGADLNPYLAMAAQLAAGLDGIERKLVLEPEISGDVYQSGEAREIPTTLGAAAACLHGSTMLRAAFGDDVVDHYHRAALWEIEENNRNVTDWDLRRGFERA